MFKYSNILFILFLVNGKLEYKCVPELANCKPSRICGNNEVLFAIPGDNQVENQVDIHHCLHRQDIQQRTSLNMTVIPEHFITLRSKKLCLIAELNFLLLCKKNNVFPNFISNKIQRARKGFHFNKSLERNKLTSLRAAIKDTRSLLAKCELELYKLHMNLLHHFHPTAMDRIDIISYAIAKSNSKKKLHVLKRKFQTILKDKTVPIATQIPELPVCSVVNKSSITLSEDQLDHLNLNMNFALDKKHLPIVDLVSQADSQIKRQIPFNAQEDIRLEIKNIITDHAHSVNPFHNTITASLNQLRKNDVYFLKADKGGQLVIVDKPTYENKTNDLLSDGSTYTVIKRDPTNKIVKSLKATVKNCISLDDKEKERLVPSKHCLPHFYALPKIHKPEMPFRPIVSNIDSINYNVAKFVSSKISFLTEHNAYTVSNSMEVISKLKSVKLESTDIMVSLDVTSLYTSVPTNEALTCLDSKLQKFGRPTLSAAECTDLLDLCSLCITKPSFIHRDKFYCQIEGLAMGSPLSSPLADIFMDDIEEKLFNFNLLPKLYLRYVDDSFLIWQHGLQALELFLLYANSIHPKIRFTIEHEVDRILPFLDILITRHDNFFETTIYRKPFSVCNPPHKFSNHPWSQKMSTFSTLSYRAIKICSNDNLLSKELLHLKAIAKSRGFEPSVIDNAVRKIRNKMNIQDTTTLQSLKSKTDKFAIIPYVPKLSNKIGKCFSKRGVKPIYKPINKMSDFFTAYKNKRKPDEKAGIYQISCSCQKTYIGQTKRCFKCRLNEHKGACGSNNNDRINAYATAVHVRDTKHAIDWSSAEIIFPCKPAYLNTAEKIFIFKNRDNLLNRKEDNTLNKFWQPLF